ncbi:MAG: hypothetical protein K6C08_10320 [Oscillospiraceae bacterium]|nr:hypothetical protein [Oscillospiraceae bacterium]
MANTYYDSALTDDEIQSALDAISGVIIDSNNGKVLVVEDGYITAKSVTELSDGTLIEKTITENGTYDATDDDADGYSSVTVSVDEATLTTKEITANGTYNASDDSADGYSSVTVAVEGGSTLGTKEITANGTYDATDDSLDGYSSVTVNVSGTGTEAVPMSVTANSTFASTPKQAYQAFGDVAGNFWGANGTTAYLYFYFASPVTIASFLASNYYRAGPSTYWHTGYITIVGSNDGFATTTELYSSGLLEANENQFEMALTTTGAFLAYRVYVQTSSAAYVGLGKMGLIFA